MTDIDRALEGLRDNPQDHVAQSGFYDLFLNSLFFVPTTTESVTDQEEGEQQVEAPMILEAEGTDYLVFFDQEQRLKDWAEQEAPNVRLPGHAIAEMTPDGLNWAMNIGTDYDKQFAPDEIAWLKDVVARCKAENDETSAQ
jgi:hypothetical protein